MLEPERMTIARELRSFVTMLSTQIKISNRNGLTDLSRSQEQSLLPLINHAYARMFRDLNTHTPNFPALDYAELSAGLGLQMTATVTKQKFQATIDKLNNNNKLKSAFREIWFFLLIVDAVPSNVIISPSEIHVKFFTLNDMVNRIQEAGLQYQKDFLKIAKREYPTYFSSNENKKTRDRFRLSDEVNIPSDLVLFNNLIDTLSWYDNDVSEGYASVYQFLDSFRKRLLVCHKDARAILFAAIQLSNKPNELWDEMEVYEDQIIGGLSVHEEDISKFYYYLETLAKNRLIEREDDLDFNNVYEVNGEACIPNRMKVVMNYNKNEPRVNLYSAFLRFYEKYHSFSEFKYAIKNADFSLLSDFRCQN